MRYIFSFCGGGIRGTLTACALVELEKQLGKPTKDIASFCAGTSTGALIASAVAAGVPATRILEIYQNRAKEIFRHGRLSLPLEVLRGYADDPQNVRRVLVSEFGPAPSAWTMDQTPIKVLIIAVGMNGHQWYFTGRTSKNSGLTGSVPLVDAATASAAAPIYFNHYSIAINGVQTDLYDGGVGGLANPSYQAAVEAFDFDLYDPVDTRIITFGTGFFPAPDVAPDGLIAEIEWTLDTLLDAADDEVDHTVNRQWPGLATKLNVELSAPVDMADVSSIAQLVEIGQKWAATLDWKKILTP
jgi:hypothetical protein